MIKKYYDESISVGSKQYRDIVRQIKKDIAKKFKNINIESTFIFLDDKNIGSIDLVIGINRNIIDHKALIDYIKSKSIKEPINNEYGLSVFIKSGKDEFVQVNIFLTIDGDSFEFVRMKNSFSIFDLILEYYSKIYGLEIKNNAIYQDDKMIYNNIKDTMGLFSLDINEYKKNMNFSDLCNKIMNSSAFVYNELYLNELFSNNKIGSIFKRLVEENKDKLQTERREHILYRVQKVLDPKEYANRLINNMENIEIEMVENLLNLYLSEDISANLSMIQMNTNKYINTLLESFYLKHNDDMLIIEANGISYAVETCYRKISNMKNDLKLFRITNIETKDFILYGFKINLNMSFRELTIDPVIFNEVEDDNFMVVCDKLNEYLNEELKLEFSFETNNHDIEAKISMNMDKNIRKIKPKDLVKIFNLK